MVPVVVPGVVPVVVPEVVPVVGPEVVPVVVLYTCIDVGANEIDASLGWAILACPTSSPSARMYGHIDELAIRTAEQLSTSDKSTRATCTPSTSTRPVKLGALRANQLSTCGQMHVPTSLEHPVPCSETQQLSPAHTPY